MTPDPNPIYYVYAWYLKSTNEIFHIGKGKNKRYLDTKVHRNKYFTAIINKYPDDVDVKIIQNNLSEQDAWDLERKLITEYKEIGQCKTNLHIGGCGGFTGNTPERSKKISDFAKTRVGELNPMFGKTHTQEARKKISEANLGRKLSPEHIQILVDCTKNRIYTDEMREHMRQMSTGRKATPEAYLKMMNIDCQYKYEVYFDNVLIYWCLGHTKLWNYCKDTFNISRAIIEQILKNTWTPKFKKHLWLTSLKIIKIDRSVSTNCDECNSVEWRLTPFEVRNNQAYFG